MIVFFLASKEEKQELMQIFQTLDLNNDGRLSLEELKLGMMKVLTTEESESHSFRIIRNVDKKQLGSIDYSSIVLFIMLSFSGYFYRSSESSHKE